MGEIQNQPFQLSFNASDLVIRDSEVLKAVTRAALKPLVWTAEKILE